MKKTLKLIFLKSKMSILSYFEWRVSLIFYILSSFTWSLASIFLQSNLFGEIETLAGWTFGEMALLYGIYNIAFTFFVTFVWTTIYHEFRVSVKKGTLDKILTKPLPHRLFVTFGHFDLAGFIHIIPSIIILFIATQNLDLNISVFNLLSALFYFLVGMYCLYSICFLIYASVFWTTSADRISNFFWSIEGQSKTILDIFPKYLKAIFISLVPIGFVAYLPAKAILGQLDEPFFLYTIGLFTILIFINHFVWKKGLKKYESVSS